MTKEELKIIALTQRISELVGNYEENIADIRADFTLIQEENARLKEEAAPATTESKDGPGDEYQ